MQAPDKRIVIHMQDLTLAERLTQISAPKNEHALLVADDGKHWCIQHWALDPLAFDEWRTGEI